VANGAKHVANGVANSAKHVASSVKKGWDTSAEKVESFCRTHPKELEHAADVAADLALKAALIGVAAICKEKERNQ
jgi:hypothetical protein